MSVLKGVVAALFIAASGVSVQARILSAECAVEDKSGCLVSMVLAYYANQNYGIDIGVEESPSGERSALFLAADKLSLTVLKSETFENLEVGGGAFQSNPIQASAASKRLRALFGYVDDEGRVTTIAVNNNMGYELAYNITAAFWNNFPSIRREVVELDEAGEPFAGVTMRLHPGALKYFEFNGYKVPQNIR